MKKYLVVSTEDELTLPWAQANDCYETIVTGVGATNVIRALKDLPRDIDILNVGYCGSNRYPIGAVVWIKECRLWHPNVEFQEMTFTLDSPCSEAVCFTAGDFVLDGEELPGHAVVDMELAHIAAFGFSRLRAVKYVSDNLNLDQYNKTIEKQ